MTLQNNYISHSKNSQKTVLRTASKTVRKFTGFTDKFCPKPLPNAVCVNVDWLAFLADGKHIGKGDEKEPVKWYGDAVCTEYQLRGAGNWDFIHKIYYHGEHVANLLSHVKDKKVVKEGVVKVEILNHVFYSTELKDVFTTILFELQLNIRSICRFDIAIDGNNYLPDFLNAYVKQRNLATARVRKKGRGRVDAKLQDNNFRFHNFTVGKGHKKLTIYNKSKEIELKSNKEYIRTIWCKSGMNPDEIGDIWRCELRLDSQEVKRFKDLELERINDPNYLLSIFRTACKNFFEFVLIEKDSNVSRAREIDLFDFKLLQVNLLERLPRAKVEGCYKAKMGIHQDVKSIVQGYVNNEDEARVALLNIRRNLELFDLQRYYTRKLPEWIDMYSRISRNPGGYNDGLKKLCLN